MSPQNRSDERDTALTSDEGRSCQGNQVDSAQKNGTAATIDRIIRSVLLVGAALVAVAFALSLARSPHRDPKQNSLKPLFRVVPNIDQMVLVPGASYQLRTEAGLAASVSLAGFYIDRNETTNRAYTEFCRRTARRMPFGSDASYSNENPQHPVWNVSARDAEAYCGSEGKRLPRESEWLVAAGGAGAFLYPWGNDDVSGRANVGAGSLRPVGTNPGDISPFGVQDMAGNLPEYVRSDQDGATYAVRGGAYYLPRDFAKLTVRFSVPSELDPSRGYARIGFRCLYEPDGSNLPVRPQSAPQ